MDTFSKRNQFDPQIPKSPVIEDAPKLLRIEYWERVLNPITYIDNDSRYSQNNGLLGIKDLLVNLCILTHTEPNENMNDSWFCNDELKSLVMDSPWYHFYDVVEYVAGRLLSDFIFSEKDFASYREKTNNAFDNNVIVWRLNAKGTLERGKLDDLQDKMNKTENILQQGFPAALQHLKKAQRFITNRPLDPENAIKEAVSSVESYGRVLYPNASTLGDVIKELKKKPFPILILNMMEKFYAFASSEPGVRHGGAISSRIGLADGDFCLYVSVAFIDYLHKLHENRN